MKSKIRIGKSPITKTIYAGRLNKDESMWVGEKHDVTEDVLRVMTEYIPENKAILMGDEADGSRKIYSCFPATETGFLRAIRFFEKQINELPPPVKS